MNHAIKLEPGNYDVKIPAFLNMEIETDAIIYRSEFNRNYEEYKKTETNNVLIFSFIFLQIYIECFLHQKMRTIIDLEFKNSNPSIKASWFDEKNERHHIEKKVPDFCRIFFNPENVKIDAFTKIIIDEFKIVSNIRNDFIHGHKVSDWSNSNGDHDISRAKSYLTKEKIHEIIGRVNKIGSAWNGLFHEIKPNLKSFKQFDRVAFNEIEI